MQICVVTLFPEMVATVAEYGVVGRAQNSQRLSLQTINPRDFADDTHRTVDDRPYGGGPGMVMKYEPVTAALHAAKSTFSDTAPVICLSPQGAVFDQAAAQRLANLPEFVLLTGRYEGIDERVIEQHVDEELSLGDFVLSGGEVAAMAVVDAVTRLLPGVLGDDESAVQDSFVEGLLDCPHYTRPEKIGSYAVPEVLLSGDHAKIAKWRQKQSLGRTFERRPDLLAQLNLNDEQQTLLAEYIEEQRQ